MNVGSESSLESKISEKRYPCCVLAFDTLPPRSITADDYTVLAWSHILYVLAFFLIRAPIFATASQLECFAGRVRH